MGTATSSQATGLGSTASETCAHIWVFFAAAVFVHSELLLSPLSLEAASEQRPLCLVQSPVPARHMSGILGILSQCLNERVAELTSCLKE